MGHWLLAALGVGGLLALIFGLGLAVVSGADPEGRGGSGILFGFLIAVCGAASTLFALVLTIWQAFH